MVVFPDPTKFAKVAVPVPVRFLIPVMSLLESVVKILLASAVPKVEILL